MKGPISFATPSLLLIIPFAMPIFFCLRSYLENLQPILIEESNIIHPFFISFLILLSNFVMGLPLLVHYLFFRRWRNTIQKKPRINKERVILVKRLIISFNKASFLQSYAIIFMATLTVSGLLIFGVILNSTYEKVLIGFKMNIALLAFNALFSTTLLKYKIHKHQVLAIMMSIIGIVLVCWNVIAEYQHSLYFIALYFFTSLVDMTEKWLMEKKYFAPIYLLFYMGCCGMIIEAIMITITSLVDCPSAWVNNLCKRGAKIEPVFSLLQEIYLTNSKGFLNIFLTVFVGSVYLIFFILTLFYYTPSHRSMSDVLSSFIMWMISQPWNSSEPLYSILMSLFGYLIILCASFMYNELVILNFCGLEKNTKHFIHLRGKEETSQELIILSLKMIEC